jgi:hypothetical protein
MYQLLLIHSVVTKVGYKFLNIIFVQATMKGYLFWGYYLGCHRCVFSYLNFLQPGVPRQVCLPFYIGNRCGDQLSVFIFW